MRVRHMRGLQGCFGWCESVLVRQRALCEINVLPLCERECQRWGQGKRAKDNMTALSQADPRPAQNLKASPHRNRTDPKMCPPRTDSDPQCRDNTLTCRSGTA